MQIRTPTETYCMCACTLSFSKHVYRDMSTVNDANFLWYYIIHIYIPIHDERGCLSWCWVWWLCWLWLIWIMSIVYSLWRFLWWSLLSALSLCWSFNHCHISHMFTVWIAFHDSMMNPLRIFLVYQWFFLANLWLFFE